MYDYMTVTGFAPFHQDMQNNPFLHSFGDQLFMVKEGFPVITITFWPLLYLEVTISVILSTSL